MSTNAPPNSIHLGPTDTAAMAFYQGFDHGMSMGETWMKVGPPAPIEAPGFYGSMPSLWICWRFQDYQHQFVIHFDELLRCPSAHQFGLEWSDRVKGEFARKHQQRKSP
jgi:hypothetical protein